MPRSPVTASASVIASMLLPPLVAVAAAQTGVVTGAVRDVAGEPIVGAEVVAENTDWQRRVEATTNDSGRFSFIGLQRGRWLFLIRQRGYEPTQGFANVRGRARPA